MYHIIRPVRIGQPSEKTENDLHPHTRKTYKIILYYQKLLKKSSLLWITTVEPDFVKDESNNEN